MSMRTIFGLSFQKTIRSFHPRSISYPCTPEGRSRGGGRNFSLLMVLVVLSAGGLVSGCSVVEQITGGGDTPAQEPTSLPVVAAGNDLTTEGRLVPSRAAWLSFLQPGPVAELLVAEGDHVNAGQLLARLGDAESLLAAKTAAELERLTAQQALDDLKENASLASSRAYQALVLAERRLIEARQSLDDLDTPEYQADLDEAWEKVQDEKEALDEAQEEFDRYADLSEDNSTRQRAEDELEEAEKRYADALREHERLRNDLEAARAAVSEAEAALEDARRAYEDRRDGPAPDDLALAEARLKNAEAQLAAAEAALADSELKAPFDGVVTTVDISAGEAAVALQPVIQLADFSTWYVETSELNEMDVVLIDPDRPVAVIPDALPELELEGEVERIAQVFNERAGEVLYTVRIRLDSGDPDLRWGMTVSVVFSRR